ncbi:uncharacterized protein rnf180a [Pungitius pungitius]|uniref:uncharacterized protein rnf180a n=1 Tax=Pungitius pungitius TaxID=134920 RepID=UPI002E16047C
MSTPLRRPSGVNVSGQVGGDGGEDSVEDNGNNRTNTRCEGAARPGPGNADPAGQGRSSSVEQLVRPALPGRKAHRKTCSKDRGGRWKGGDRDRDEETGHFERDAGGRGKGKPRQREAEGSGTQGDGDRDRPGTGGTDSLSSGNSDTPFNNTLEVGEGSTNFQRGLTHHRLPSTGCTRTFSTNVNPQSPRPAMRSISSDLHQPPNQTRSTPLCPRRMSSSTAAGNLHRHSFSSRREADPLGVEVGTGAATAGSSQSPQTHILSLIGPELREEEEQEGEEGEGEEEEEEEEEEEDLEDGEERGSGVMGTTGQTASSTLVVPSVPFGDRRMSKREKNRIKYLRRRQKRRERWRQSQLQESRQSSTGNPSSSSEDEDMSAGDKERYICAVCLDVYFSPYMCQPCNHIFCEPCLRTLAKNSPTSTPCPLCRTIITHVFFQKELNQTARTFFPKEYLSRRQNFQKASCAKWPLPSCRKVFRIFGGFQRQSGPIVRRQFPHGGGHQLGDLDFEEDSRGWSFDMDMVIIYIYSANWVIGFFIFCFLCYLFFPSF